MKENQIKKEYQVLFSILFCLAIGSCAPISRPIQDNPIPKPTITPMEEVSNLAINTPDSLGTSFPSSSSNQYVKLAKQNLADQLQIDITQIQLLKIIEINWQDIAQGCSPNTNQVLTKGKLSGYRIWLKANNKDYVYHIGLDGEIHLCPSE